MTSIARRPKATGRSIVRAVATASLTMALALTCTSVINAGAANAEGTDQPAAYGIEANNGVSVLSIAACAQQIQESGVASIAEQAASCQQQEMREAALDTVMNTAYSLLGTPYRTAGATPEGFDCSGFTMYCFAQAGIDLTHFADAQYDQGIHVDINDLQVGDLVFFGSENYFTHVGIYVGDGNFIHSKQTGDDVCIEPLSVRNNFVAACRVL